MHQNKALVANTNDLHIFEQKNKLMKI